MTQRQEKFIDEFILNGGNGTAAARAAGYSARSARTTASKLLSDNEIRAAIDEQLNAAKTERTLNQTALIEFFSSIVRGEVKDEVLMSRLTGKGISTIEKHEVRASVRERIKAAEILLKISGAFDKQQDKSDDGTNLFVQTLEKIWREDNATA